MTHILESKPHPEQGYRACLGLMRLGRGYGHERMVDKCTSRTFNHLGEISDADRTDHGKTPRCVDEI